jgi:tRNA-uridine 2-sulfurtransferase
MRRSADRSKDQTYFLFGLKQDQLARTLFPLGGMEKPRCANSRASSASPPPRSPTARKSASCPTATTPPSSTPIFASKESRPLKRAANWSLPTASVVGEHAGVHHFTVGQRRGLGVAAGEPLYVISTEPVIARVVIGRNDALLRATMTVNDVNWISIAAPIRRREPRSRSATSTAASATITPTADPSRVEVHFDEPQRAVTPGQGAVFYSGELVLGGGWIG